MNVKLLRQIFLFGLLLFASSAGAAVINGPDVSMREGNIVVSTALRLDEKELAEIEKGIAREIVFYIDLFKSESRWPDEFVIGKRFTRTIKCDPVKQEYAATSLSGVDSTEQRFSGCGPLLKWALNVPDVYLANIAALHGPGYFVKVTVESRLRRLPPIISSILFFVDETEFNISKSSPSFTVGPETGNKP